MPRNLELIAGVSSGMLLIALIACAGCSSREPEDYVVRVGDAVLTRAELAANVDTTEHNSGAIRAFVNRWVVSTLLYQEASRRGLATTTGFQQQLENVRRTLAVNALLESTIYADTVAISDDAIVNLYSSAGETFLLKEDVVNLSSALFAERDAANAFRSRIVRGSSWGDALAAIQQDSADRGHLLQLATRQYFTRATLYPEELWKLARSLPPEQVSFVVRTDAGYYVLMVHSLRQQGEMPDFEYVRNEIRDRLLMEERQRAYERLVDSLRAETRVDVRIGVVDSPDEGME